MDAGDWSKIGWCESVGVHPLFAAGSQYQVELGRFQGCSDPVEYHSGRCLLL